MKNEHRVTAEKEKGTPECGTCVDYRARYNVAIANGLVMEARRVNAQWGGHNRAAHRDD